MLWEWEFHDSPVFSVKSDRFELNPFLAALSKWWASFISSYKLDDNNDASITLFEYLNDIISVKSLTQCQAHGMHITVGFVIINMLFINTEHSSLSCVIFSCFKFCLILISLFMADFPFFHFYFVSFYFQQVSCEPHIFEF